MRKILPWVLGGAVVAVVLAALVTVVVVGREPDRLPAGSPEAAVQEYLDAVLDRDSDAAVVLLAPESPCEVDDFDHAWVDDDVHATLEEVVVTDATARVDVSITSDSGGLLPGGWTDEWTFRLRQVGDTWLITGEPWPVFECGATFR